MNDLPQDDSPLSSFESQIANQYPSVSTSDRDKLLYACAFSAGRKAGSRSVASWRLATAAASVMLVGALIPYGLPRPPGGDRQIQHPPPTYTIIHTPPAPPRTETSLV